MSEPVTEYVIGRREGGKRLDHYLHERIPRLSRNRIQRTIRDRVRLSWTADVRPSTPVRAGGRIFIDYEPPVEVLRELTLPILARGRGWMAVDKPAGVVVHPVNGIVENSLIRILRRQEGQPDLRLVHRLDSETSGVLLVAEDPETSRFLSLAFYRGTVDKRYLAVVAGAVEVERGRIDRPIGKATGSRVFVKQQVGSGSPAVTEWRRLRRSGDRSLLWIRPETGRRHQIRVHLASIGHPVLGDLLYAYPEQGYLDLVRGGGDVRQQGEGPRRQLLHCTRLVFPDPAGGGPCRVQSRMPAEFRRYLD